MSKLQEIKDQLKYLEVAIEMMNETLTDKVDLDDLYLDAGYIKERARTLYNLIDDSLEEDEEYVDRRMKLKR